MAVSSHIRMLHGNTSEAHDVNEIDLRHQTNVSEKKRNTVEHKGKQPHLETQTHKGTRRGGCL
jgi:hypothetical protein